MKNEKEEYVATSIGNVPIEDYREIKAGEYGFDSYKDLYMSGYRIGLGLDIDSDTAIREWGVSFFPLKQTERLYAYPASSEVSSKSGLIGCLTAKIDKNSPVMVSHWEGFSDDLKSQSFKNEFDNVLADLRKDGKVLSNLNSMSSYCDNNAKKASLTNDNEYGIRIITDNYAYIMRLNPQTPQTSECNLYCYCYIRESLYEHIQRAEKGILFVDGNYQEAFRIPDGENILITARDGMKTREPCRFIDECHTQIGGRIYRIDEFAEVMKKGDYKYDPYGTDLDGIPDRIDSEFNPEVYRYMELKDNEAALLRSSGIAFQSKPSKNGCVIKYNAADEQQIHKTLAAEKAKSAPAL